MIDPFHPQATLAAARATLASSRSDPNSLARAKVFVPSSTYDNSRRSRNSRGDHLLVSQSSSLAPKDRIESDIYIYQGFSPSEWASDPHQDPGTPREGPSTPARVAILREDELSALDQKENEVFALARVLAAKVYVPGPADLTLAPREWVDGHARLVPDQTPCSGFGFNEWTRVYAAILPFLEQHGEAAYRLGWTTLDLFGVHAEVGAARVDCCGALMVSNGSPVVALTADAIAFRRNTFRRAAPPRANDASVPVWSFAR